MTDSEATPFFARLREDVVRTTTDVVEFIDDQEQFVNEMESVFADYKMFVGLCLLARDNAKSEAVLANLRRIADQTSPEVASRALAELRSRGVLQTVEPGDG